MNRQTRAWWESALMIGGTWKHCRRWEWRLAWFVDAMHVPAMFIMATGWLWGPRWFHPAFMAAALMLQAITMGCPIMDLADWLRSRAKSERWARSGVVARMHHRYPAIRGAKFGLGVMEAVIATAYIVGWLPT